MSIIGILVGHYIMIFVDILDTGTIMGKVVKIFLQLLLNAMILFFGFKLIRGFFNLSHLDVDEWVMTSFNGVIFLTFLIGVQDNIMKDLHCIFDC